MSPLSLDISPVTTASAAYGASSFIRLQLAAAYEPSSGVVVTQTVVGANLMCLRGSAYRRRGESVSSASRPCDQHSAAEQLATLFRAARHVYY